MELQGKKLPVENTPSEHDPANLVGRQAILTFNSCEYPSIALTDILAVSLGTPDAPEMRPIGKMILAVINMILTLIYYLCGFWLIDRIYIRIRDSMAWDKP